MPSKKKKYNARFPAGRIKKIMQTDEEVGKVAQAVPVIISRTLELFVQSLLTKSMQITKARSAKTLTPSHMKQCILAESRFDFLRDLVKDVPDPSTQEDDENNIEIDYIQNKVNNQAPPPPSFESGHKGNVAGTFYMNQGTSSARTPVIQYGPAIAQMEQSTPSIETLVDGVKHTEITEPNYKLDLSQIATGNLVSQADPAIYPSQTPTNVIYTHVQAFPDTSVPPLIPISQTNMFGHGTGDNLYIDEDYDN